MEIVVKGGFGGIGGASIDKLAVRMNVDNVTGTYNCTP